MTQNSLQFFMILSDTSDTHKKNNVKLGTLNFFLKFPSTTTNEEPCIKYSSIF